MNWRWYWDRLYLYTVGRNRHHCAQKYDKNRTVWANMFIRQHSALSASCRLYHPYNDSIAKMVFFSAVSVCGCVSVSQCDNSWTIWDSMLTFSRRQDMVKSSDEFENCCILLYCVACERRFNGSDVLVLQYILILLWQMSIRHPDCGRCHGLHCLLLWRWLSGCVQYNVCWRVDYQQAGAT